MDISQSVLAKFFVIVQRDGLEIDTRSQLRRLLFAMAGNKIRDYVRRQHAAKRDGRRIVGDSALASVTAGGKTPSVLLSESELYDAILERLAPDDRALVVARIEGDSWPELASRCGMSPDAVRKRVTRALERASANLDVVADDEPAKEIRQ